MAGKVNYRIVTLVAALASAVLSAIALAFLITSLVEYRADDFFTASKTKDFTTLGTCVETMTRAQLKELDYNNGEIDCKDNDDKGNRLKLINTLRSTVHGVYYAYHHDDAIVSVTDNKGVTTTKDASAWHDAGNQLRQLMAAQVAHVLGRQTAFGYDPATFVNVGLNFSMAFEALSLVDMIDVPVSCDDIYGLSFTDISNDHMMVPQSADPIAAGGAATIEGHYLDTEWELYIKNIRKGRLDSDGNTKETWPLQEFSIDCPGEGQTQGVDYIPGAGATGDVEATPLTDDMKKYMYAH